MTFIICHLLWQYARHFFVGRKSVYYDDASYFLYSECSSNKGMKSSLQDATHENIPIMMVGNKADLRQAVTEQGQKCVPINYGEKLAMVRSKYTSLV